MCTNNKLKFYESIEIQLVAGTTSLQIKFPDQPQLREQGGRKVKIKSIEMISPVVSPLTPMGDTNAPATEYKKMSLVLSRHGKNVLMRIPLFKLNRVNDLTNPFVFELPELADLDIDWAKSFIQYSGAPAGLPYTILLGVEYDVL